MRGYPDIAASRNNIVVYVEGSLSLIGGTSANCPIVASLVTLVNEQRIQSGKGPVGFINPVLYSNPTALDDITVGSNPGVGTAGFSAVPGWDPVSSLGTPDYQKLLNIFDSALICLLFLRA
jgi:tripeptidyl-peptidase I